MGFILKYWKYIGAAAVVLSLLGYITVLKFSLLQLESDLLKCEANYKTLSEENNRTKELLAVKKELSEQIIVKNNEKLEVELKEIKKDASEDFADYLRRYL
jgi:hypothetical protein